MDSSLATRLAHASPLKVAAGLAALHLLVAGLAFDPVPHTGGDNAAYLTLARSILDHGAYLELWDPARSPHTKYPPGFPLLLAAALGLGITSWVALKAIMIGFSVLGIGLAYLWMRAATRPVFALGAGLLLALAPGIVGESHWILSDVPFFAATMASLLALERGRLGAGIALAFLALLIRTAALPLLAGIALWLLLHKRWRPALGVVVGVAFLATVWTLRGRGLEVPYASAFWMVNPYQPEAGTIGVADLLVRLVRNGERYAFTIFMRSLTGLTGAIPYVVGGMLLAFAGIGFARRLRPTRIAPAELFAGLYAAVLLTWPATWASDRFLLPLMPLILVYSAEGVEVVRRPRVRQALWTAGVAILLSMAAVPMTTLWAGAAGCRAATRAQGITACLHPGEGTFIELARDTRGELPEGAVVLSRKPRLWYHFSGVPSRVYPFSRNPDRLLRVARDVGADYVVLDRLGAVSRVYLTPVITRHKERFCVLSRRRYRGGEAILLRILPEGAAGVPRPGPLRPPDADRVELQMCGESSGPSSGGLDRTVRGRGHTPDATADPRPRPPAPPAPGAGT